MTRKDYEMVAKVLRETYLPEGRREMLALNLAAAFKRDNPRFLPTRFCQATRPDKADSPAIQANNAKGFERSMPDGTIQHWRPLAK